MTTQSSRTEVVPATDGAVRPQAELTSGVAFAEALPVALVSVLERRYLSPFDPAQWQLESRTNDRARPLLRQVLALGRSRQPGDLARAMPHVLTACHEPGHALMLLMHGHDSEHRVYLGGRRLAGSAARCTEDYLESQAGAFKAFFHGLELGPVRCLNATDLPELTGLLASGQSMGVVTGIPSGRGGRLALDTQSLDRLVKAVGSHRYALTIVAEPLSHEEMDAALDRCRRLRSEIHSYIRSTRTRGTTTSRTGSRSEDAESQDWRNQLPTYLMGLSLFLSVVGIPLAGPMQSAAYFTTMQMRRGGGHTSQGSDSQSASESGSVDLLDANAEACDRLLQRHIDRLQAARTGGWWRTAVYILGENEAALLAVSGALRAIGSGDMTDLDPLRLIPLPGSLLRPAVQQGQILTMRPAVSELGHPLGEPYEALGTCLNSDELAVLVNLPKEEIPGIPVRERSEFALTVPPGTPDSIHLGSVQDATGRDLAPVFLPADALNRHVFVTGITGSGKTNTCMQMLLQADEKLHVPFLVIEPAKTEYRALKAVAGLGNRLRVLSIGGANPLRLNPFLPVPGIPLGRHIDLLKAVFNGSFPMFAGMAYVLEEALHEVYVERGWNLFDSSNPYLPKVPSRDQLSALMPALEDVHDKIEVVLSRKAYGKEIHQNLGAALRSRLHSLSMGNKGLVLNTRRSIAADELFGQPTVIELQELADDEEKAFVMALLFVLLYEYAEVRQRSVPPEQRERLQHLTLIEEAHRLLQAPRGASSPEVGDPRGKAVAMFTDMLAEMRALGEGFLVADQIPTKLAPEILKNSNVKIVHRLVAPDDRLAAGSCLNLSERQCRDLNNLTRGMALFHDERVGEAFLVRVEPVKGNRVPLGVSTTESANRQDTMQSDRSHLFRHAGCRRCPRPCHFLHLLDRRHQDPVLRQAEAAFFQMLLTEDADRCWSTWTAWRDRLEAVLPSDSERRSGGLYCSATQAAHRWLMDMFSAREQTQSDQVLSPVARLAIEDTAAALAPFFQCWVAAVELDGSARDLFTAARKVLQDALFTTPPRELPGCRECPCRCALLPFVAPHLRRLGKTIEEITISQQPLKMRLATLEQAVNSTVHHALSAEKPLRSATQDARNWAYCLATNAPFAHATEQQRQALLTEIRVSGTKT